MSGPLHTPGTWPDCPECRERHVREQHAARAAALSGVDKWQCGQCGDWLRPQDIQGHGYAEGREVFAVTDRAGLREALAEGLHKAMCLGPRTLHNRLACERAPFYLNLAEAALAHPAIALLMAAEDSRRG